MVIENSYHGRFQHNKSHETKRHYKLETQGYRSKYGLNNPIENPNRNSNALLDLIILPCTSIRDQDVPFININAKIACYEPRCKFIRSFKKLDYEKHKIDMSRITFSSGP